MKFHVCILGEISTLPLSVKHFFGFLRKSQNFPWGNLNYLKKIKNVSTPATNFPASSESETGLKEKLESGGRKGTTGPRGAG